MSLKEQRYLPKGYGSGLGGVISRTALVFALLAAMGLRADDSYLENSGARAELVNAARAEKVLVIYNTVHANATLTDILGTFHKRYPFVSVQDTDGDAAGTYARFVREVRAGQPSADFIWTLGMDLQEKLINDGFALPYSSPELAFLPPWAHWKNLGYGVTLEPVAFVYNGRYLTNREMPKTHAELRNMLRGDPARYRERVALYDPEQSEVGMLLLSQDIQATPDAWQTFGIFGTTNAQRYTTSRDMLAHVVSGDQWIAYDVIASYAIEAQKTHHELVVVYPTDYVLTLSRVGFIAASARHPNAAKLFLDFLLSEEGQRVMRNHSIGSVRAGSGVPKGQPALDATRTQAIRIGPGLLADLDSLVRAQFLRGWHALFSSLG